jgi:ribosomal protein S8
MTKEGYCTNHKCSSLRKHGKPLWTRLRYHHEKEQVCESCFERFVFESRRANQVRPTKRDMKTALAEALAPLSSRITILELENAALRQALQTRVPLTETKTEVARALMLAGEEPGAVAVKLGLTAKRCREIRRRDKRRTGGVRGGVRLSYFFLSEKR